VLTVPRAYRATGSGAGRRQRGAEDRGRTDQVVSGHFAGTRHRSRPCKHEPRDAEKLMRTRIGTSVFWLCLAAAALAQDVHVTYNHAIDFTQFHTYAWGQMPKPSQVKNPKLAQEAQNQLNSTLAAKGLQMVALTAKPDLILTISGASQEKTFYSNYDPSGTVLTAG